MLGYICKYAPIEIFESMGVTMRRIEPDVTNFNQAEIKMHPNICSFAKGVLEDVMTGGYEGVILTTCCDSIRRLYDVLREEYPDKFIYMLDTPRLTKEAGVDIYEQRIRAMIASYEKFSGKTFDEAAFVSYVKGKEEKRNISHKTGALNIGILGARANENIKKILEEKGANVAFDLTCTGLGRKIFCDESEVLKSYARGLLSQFPCMRMEQASNRDEMIRRYADSVDGIIYHTVQFCDNYAYEYAWLKEWLKRPVLLLETDYTRQSYGQILTRIEAFLESLQPKRPHAKKNMEGDRAMYVLGIDSGSTSTDVVILDQDGKIKSTMIIPTGGGATMSAEKSLELAVEKAGIKKEEIVRIDTTGYGRAYIDSGDDSITEITCHAKGAHYLNPNVRTVIDIGGQDIKAISIDENGAVKNFLMNDKCAAGTGRFLEMMARTLGLSLEEMSVKGLDWKENVVISSMCTVFAESEVVSLVAQNKEVSDIIHGLNVSVASKVGALAARLGKNNPGEYMMTGGVAKNQGIIQALEEKLGAKLYICDEAQLCGALGAAIFAYEKCKVQKI